MNDADVSCDKRSTEEFEILTHQRVVRDYLNLFSPYRGLLIYHGLGSGKTCTSIAVAEGMKSEKQIIIMTPASLKSNFFSEIKKCGDDIYRKNQQWIKVRVTEKKDASQINKVIGVDEEYILDFELYEFARINHDLISSNIGRSLLYQNGKFELLIDEEKMLFLNRSNYLD